MKATNAFNFAECFSHNKKAHKKGTKSWEHRAMRNIFYASTLPFPLDSCEKKNSIKRRASRERGKIFASDPLLRK
jgi:hypothetical protein